MPSASSKKVHEVTPRRWGLYPVLDWYVFREFMIPFTVLILAFIVMFVIADVFNDLEDFLSHKASLGTMAEYFLLKLPGNIRFILPISVLLSCMYTMANFGKHMEVTAMRSSGVSLMRCSGAMFGVGLVVTLVNFYFNEQLVPYSEREAYIIHKQVVRGKDYQLRMYGMLVYRSPDKQRTWLFKYFDTKGNHKDVTVKKYRSDETLEWDIAAETAHCTPQGWVFHNATLTGYSQSGLLPKSPVFHKELVKPSDEIPEQPRQIADAVKPPEELPSLSILELLLSTHNMATSCRNIYSTILYNRLAFPWACFLAVFLAIPLATKNERSGIFMAIMVAMIVIVTYYVVTECFVIMGKQGYLPPFIAGLAPTIGFIAFGWFNATKRL